MGRPRSVKSSMFTVPQISRTIARRSLTPKEIVDTPMIRAGKAVQDPLRIPEVQLGKSRTGLLKKLLARNRIRQSELTFSELQLKKNFPTLVHTEVNCIDEAELRSRFPKQGVSHPFFKSGNATFQFWLPKDSSTVVVAQIHWEDSARMPLGL